MNKLSRLDGQTALPRAPRYTPFSSGRYEVKPGLHRLGHDFGNGVADHKTVQLDDSWPHYREAKLAARAEEFGKYVCSDEMAGATRREAANHLMQIMSTDEPGLFQLASGPDGDVLSCALSAERLCFNRNRELTHVDCAHGITYSDTFDALICQLQEDVAILETRDRVTSLSYLHLCYPNHWAARDKIGQDFGTIHGPVPHMERISRNAPLIMDAIVQIGPCVRFAWGLSSDATLNRHPLASTRTGDEPGRGFSASGPLFVRIERQVLAALTGTNALMFLIRTYFIDVDTLSGALRERLAQAVLSMSEPMMTRAGTPIGVVAVPDRGW